MMTMLMAALLLLVILSALYAFGVFNTPYLDAFRFAFYLLLVMLIIVVVVSIGDNPKQGYDPTTASP
jgi:hypothetical protein